MLPESLSLNPVLLTAVLPQHCPHTPLQLPPKAMAAHNEGPRISVSLIESILKKFQTDSQTYILHNSPQPTSDHRNGNMKKPSDISGKSFSCQWEPGSDGSHYMNESLRHDAK